MKDYIFVLFMILVLIGGIMLIFISQPQPVCKKYAHIKEFVQAVGHKIDSSYLYVLDNGEKWEGLYLYPNGRKICQEYTKQIFHD